eukprot:TRINITY_DN3893_c0_g2_i1.p1 TRINITY_DN3893_c0_g2~~TRINITY_DN3893_c0_g2_i1.p1  ORF type:complete len:278 (+),score=38.12 TRINITY_DN3893_c0_g2_i1:122-835(+)
MEHVIKKRRRDIVSLIVLDLPRTFPLLAFFQEGGTFHDNLRRILEAFVCFRSDLGYVQGMSYLAATLLLYMDEYPAFQCLCNLLRTKLLTSFYSMDMEKIGIYTQTFDSLFALFLPQLYNHFQEQEIKSQIFFVDWILTLFTKSLPIDVAAHIVDLYILKGDGFLFRAGLGILKALQGTLLNLEFDGIMFCLQSLSKQEAIQDESLFKAIKELQWTGQHYRDALKKQLLIHKRANKA